MRDQNTTPRVGRKHGSGPVVHPYTGFPDGRQRETWSGITYFRVRPLWLRYSEFRTTPPTMVELSATQLSALNRS